MSVTGQGNPEQVQALDVTDGVLPILGLPPVLGRWFNRMDDSPAGPDTVMLSYDYWESAFRVGSVHRGTDNSGRRQSAPGHWRDAQRQFRFLDWEQPSLFLPLRLDRSKITLGEFSYEGLADCGLGSRCRRQTPMWRGMWPIVINSFPAPPGFSLDLFKKARLGPNVRPLSQDVIGDVGKLLWVLMGSIGVVLLIACANVANLLLVRAEGRHQELAVCSALGRKSVADSEAISAGKRRAGSVGQRAGVGARLGSAALAGRARARRSFPACTTSEST